MSAAMWLSWDGADPVHRAADAGSVTAVCALLSDLLDHGDPNLEVLGFLRGWLAEPRWEHCPDLALLPVSVLRDRVARMIVAKTGAGADDLLAYYRARGELVDDAPDDLSQLPH